MWLDAGKHGFRPEIDGARPHETGHSARDIFIGGFECDLPGDLDVVFAG